MAEPDHPFYQQLVRELFAREGRLTLLSRLRLSTLEPAEYLQACRHLIPLRPSTTPKALPTVMQLIDGLVAAYQESDASRALLAAQVGLVDDFLYYFQRPEVILALRPKRIYSRLAVSGDLAILDYFSRRAPVRRPSERLELAELSFFYGSLEMGLRLVKSGLAAPKDFAPLPPVQHLMSFAIRSLSPSTLEGLWQYWNRHPAKGSTADLHQRTNNRFFLMSIDYQNLFGVNFFASKVTADFRFDVALERVLTVADNIHLFVKVETLCRQHDLEPDYALLLQKTRQYGRSQIEDYLSYHGSMQYLLRIRP